MKTISRYIMTLALLITAVGGAWAADTYTVAGNNTAMFGSAWDPSHTANDMTKNGDGTYSITYTNVYLDDEVQYKVVKDHSWFEAYPDGDNRVITIAEAGTYTVTIHFNPNTHEVYETMPGSGSGDPDIEVTWNAATKTGTFTMPAYDVEIAPIYAKAAAFATTGTEPELKTLLPTAIEGIFAGTTDAIVKAGTVAMMGKTENPQGIVMYAVTSINQATAPELSAFSATVPTAENIADEGADVLIWYYIQGANTPDGEEATAENTFNDSEICETPIKVTVLPNKYDIQFNAANDNTIEAGKATVTVGGTAATVTEGKLQGVKMGSEVKVKANTGYKFRKVEVKKGGAATLATALENGATVVIAFKYRDDGTCTFTNNNGTFTFVSGTGQLGGGNGPKQLSVENGKLIFKGSGTNSFTDRWSWYGFQVTFDPTANTYEVWKGSDLDVASFTSISVNGTDITDQLSELK